MRRRPLLVLVLAATALLAGAAPAGAVTPFGPIVTVVPAPAGCAVDHVDGDAEISPFNGVIRGFANFSGTGCDQDAIWFFGGGGGSWTLQQTPYQGQVWPPASTRPATCCSPPAPASTSASGASPPATT